MIVIVNSEGKVRCWPNGDPMTFETIEQAGKAVKRQGLTDAWPIDTDYENNQPDEELSYGHEDALW